MLNVVVGKICMEDQTNWPQFDRYGMAFHSGLYFLFMIFGFSWFNLYIVCMYPKSDITKICRFPNVISVFALNQTKPHMESDPVKLESKDSTFLLLRFSK